MKRLRIILAVAVVAAITAMTGAAWWVVSLGPLPRIDETEYSALVLDREGRLLRPYATPQGRWRLPATLDGVDPRYVTLLLAYEDRRFRSHPGVEWHVAAGLGHQGGLATPVGRRPRACVRGSAERTGAPHGKTSPVIRAVELEYRFGKDEVLALYLSLAPYGGNLGVRAACLPVRQGATQAHLAIRAAGAAAIAGAATRPFDYCRRAARDRVLDRIALAGIVPADEIARAKHEPVPAGRKSIPRLLRMLPIRWSPRRPAAAFTVSPSRRRCRRI
jgi:penicillin-binding protein 1C